MARADKKTGPEERRAIEGLTTEQIVNAIAGELEPDKRAMLQRLFLRARQEASHRAVGVLAVMLLVAIGGVIVLALHISTTKEFYNISQDGEVQRASTIEAKDVRYSRLQITRWANRTLRKSFEFTHRNVDRIIDEVTQERYTEQGAILYGKEIKNLREQVVRSAGVLSIEFEGKTRFKGSKKTSTGQVWRVVKPIRLILDRKNANPLELKGLADLTVVKVDEWENEKGLAVSRIIIARDDS